MNTIDVTLECSLLAAMARKINLNSYEYLIDYKRVLPVTAVLLKDYKKYFELYPDHDEIDFSQFQTQFVHNWHMQDLDNLDINYYVQDVFPKLINTNFEEAEKSLLGLIDKQTTEEIAELTAKSLDLNKIRGVLDQYEHKRAGILLQYDPDVITSTNVDLEMLDKSQGIPYFLPSLQENLGGLIPGQFVVVSADSNTGKSAFVLSQAVKTFNYISNNKDKGPILYFNSEGTPGDVFARFWSNLYKDDVLNGIEAIVEHRNEIRSRFNTKTEANKFMVFQLGFNNINYIKTKLKKYKPSLVIIDMLDVLASVEDPITLKKLYDSIRLLSLEYCPIIGTTQSGNTSWFDKESGEEKTKKFLTDKDVLGCKAKSAAAETVITIGKDSTNKQIRYISTPKKKRGKEVFLTCTLNESYSLYEELVF